MFFRGIDNYAHAGGFIVGFILGKIMADRAPVSPEERKRAYFLGWASALLVVASFSMVVFINTRGRLSRQGVTSPNDSFSVINRDRTHRLRAQKRRVNVNAVNNTLPIRALYFVVHG